jgi:anaphase-promoting complex subunit 3
MIVACLALGLQWRNWSQYRFGMGIIYYKQEKFELAAMHFDKALALNSKSTILQCYLGLVSYSSVHALMARSY